MDKEKEYQCIWQPAMMRWYESVSPEKRTMSPNARECTVCDGLNVACERFNSGRTEIDITGTKSIIDNISWKGLGGDYLK